MNITLRTVLDSFSSFVDLQDIKFTPKICLNIYKMSKALDKELETYRTLSKKLYEDNGITVTDKGPDMSGVEPDKFAEVSKLLDELLDTEVEMPDIILKINDLEKANITLTPRNITALEWFIKEDDA